MTLRLIIGCVLVVSVFHGTHSKYVEGHLKTLDDWAFVARFCFISGRGRYEYHIEFERKYGEPQLLLYYDDESQWPSVYKTSKSCLQKISVLSPMDNQIVTLSARPPYSYMSGCRLTTNRELNRPTNPPPVNSTFYNTSPTEGDTLDSTYFDQFLKTTTESAAEDWLNLDNETDVFNATNRFVPVKRDGLDSGNSLENGTEYQFEVEEMFAESSTQKYIRVRRGIPLFSSRDSTRGTIIVSCSNAGGFTSVRERWWYIAIANCGSGKGLDLKYRFRMTNGPPGDFWHEHFSADEMYIPPILLTESIVYTVLLLAVFLCAIELKTRHLFHCTYRLFTFSAMIQYFGIISEAIAWTKYAVSGLGPHTMLGQLLLGASEISFLALLLLMAKGYTITRARLSSCSTVKLTIFINLYIVIYISLFVYQSEAFDPGEVLNLYESPAGFGLVGLRVGSWGAFMFAISATLKKYPEKGSFYYPFGLLGSMWILGGPFLTVVGVGVLDAWVRESVMRGTAGAMAFGGHVAFLWLTWPSRANRSFPYHVRTNHIGSATGLDDGLDYPQHPYEPSHGQENIIIPLSRRTEELLSGVYNQYIIERDHYGSPLNPNSHISFPHTIATAPPPLFNRDTELTTPTFEQQLPENPAQVRMKQYQQMSNLKHDEMIDDDTASTHDSQLYDNQVDSGHPSFENPSQSPTSPNSTRTPPALSQISTPHSNEGSASQRLKNNPFLVANGMNRGPNKIILEPIEYPIANGMVPRHLFAAKSASSSTNF